MRVLLFARARELAGKEELMLSLPEGARLRDAALALGEKFPQLRTYLSHCRLAVNQEFEELDKALLDDAEVAVIPPVSGGSSG